MLVRDKSSPGQGGKFPVLLQGSQENMDLQLVGVFILQENPRKNSQEKSLGGCKAKAEGSKCGRGIWAWFGDLGEFGTSNPGNEGCPVE